MPIVISRIRRSQTLRLRDGGRSLGEIVVVVKRRVAAPSQAAAIGGRSPRDAPKRAAAASDGAWRRGRTLARPAGAEGSARGAQAEPSRSEFEADRRRRFARALAASVQAAARGLRGRRA